MWRWAVVAVSGVALVAIIWSAIFYDQGRKPVEVTPALVSTPRLAARSTQATQVPVRPSLPLVDALATAAPVTQIPTVLPASASGPSPTAAVAIPMPTLSNTPTVPASSTISPAPVRTGTPAAGATLESGSRVYVIANTDGQSIYIRRNPADPSSRVRLWPAGAIMVSAGEADRQADGRTWKNVRDPDGTVGWVAIDFLAPRP
jgi:hypothetical protein